MKGKTFDVYGWSGTAWGEPARIDVVSGSDEILAIGRARLGELEGAWRLGGLETCPGVMVPVPADTVLLAERVNREAGRRRLLVDARHGQVGRLDGGAVELAVAIRSLACELVLQALLESGAGHAEVRIGPYTMTGDQAPDGVAA
jgi:hypothetical protein